jgi:hypothetical protein
VPNHSSIDAPVNGMPITVSGPKPSITRWLLPIGNARLN